MKAVFPLKAGSTLEAKQISHSVGTDRNISEGISHWRLGCRQWHWSFEQQNDMNKETKKWTVSDVTQDDLNPRICIYCQYLELENSK